MFEFVKNIWSIFGIVFNDFMNFIIENRLTSLLIVAILGLAITGLITSLKTNIIEYYLNKIFKTKDNNLIMFLIAFVQFLIIILLIFIIYKYVIQKFIKPFNKKGFDEEGWKNNMLLELKSLNQNIQKCKT